MGTGVKWFHLSINEYYEELLDHQGLRLGAISVIKYPVFFIQAIIRKYDDDDTYFLDYQILKIIDYFGITDEESINLILGVKVRWRIDTLENSGCLMISGDKIELTEDGAEFVREPDQRIEIIVDENFYVDGVTLKPLTKEYYDKHKRFGAIHTFIEHGDSDFSPDITPEIPDDAIVENIMSIPIDERSAYSIPEGLIEVIRLDPVRMIHPLGVAYASNDEGDISKRLIDCCDSFPTDEFLLEQKNNLKDRIHDLQVTGTLTKKRREQEVVIRSEFYTNWDLQKSSKNQIIFGLTSGKLKSIISDSPQCNIDVRDVDDLVIEAGSIKWKIDKKYFTANDANTEDLINALTKERFYIHQHESTGVWLVFIEFSPNDQFVKDLLKLSGIIENDKYDWNELINDFGVDDLRELLISMGKYIVFEDLDTYLFLSSFSSGKYTKSRFHLEK